MITMCLAVMRYIATKFPFYRPKKKILMAVMAAYCLIYGIYYIYATSFTESSKWHRSGQLVFTAQNTEIHKYVKIAQRLTMLAINILSSVLTVYEMVKNKDSPNFKARSKGSKAVLIMTAGSIFLISLMLMLLSWPNDAFIVPGLFLMFNFGVVLSAFNPLVIILLNSRINTFIRDGVRSLMDSYIHRELRDQVFNTNVTTVNQEARVNNIESVENQPDDDTQL